MLALSINAKPGSEGTGSQLTLVAGTQRGECMADRNPWRLSRSCPPKFTRLQIDNLTTSLQYSSHGSQTWSSYFPPSAFVRYVKVPAKNSTRIR